MPAANSMERSRFDRAAAALCSLGDCLFAGAIIALGIETLACAQRVGHSLGPKYEVISALPWLPAIPWMAYVFGFVWVVCGLGMLSKRTMRTAAMALGVLLFLCALILDIPKYAVELGSISLRTTALEPLALASLACLIPGKVETPSWLERGSRYVLGLSLVVFGVDHFLALGFIANLLPGWIPWHVFWVAFFGVVLIASGVSVGVDVLLRWGAAGAGLMFGIWVVTLHLPRVLGLYGVPGAPSNANEWSSLFIAVAMWGGLWALARVEAP